MEPGQVDNRLDGPLTVSGGTLHLGNQYINSNVTFESNFIEQDVRDMMAYLSPKDPLDGIRRATEGTCEWFPRCQEMKNWLAHPAPALFWLSAGPGCGKSVLCRWLAEQGHLAGVDQFMPVCKFFFRDGLDGRKTASDAIAALIHQILSNHLKKERLQRYALSRWRSHGHKLDGRRDELWSILMDIARDPDAGEIICLIDALDECESASRSFLLEKLVDLSTPERRGGQSHQLKLFTSSRPYEDMLDESQILGSASMFFKLDGNRYHAEISRDIDIVLQAELGGIFRKRNAASREKILAPLRNGSYGTHRTYLWLYLTLDWLRDLEKQNVRSAIVKRKLQQLPPQVNEYYNKMLLRSSNPQEALALLQIVVAAARPLTLEELNIARALWPLDIEARQPLSASEDVFDETMARSSLENLCGLFIQIYDGRAYLLHQTAREFLINANEECTEGSSWQGAVNLTDAHRIMTKTLMVCLDPANLPQTDDDCDNSQLEYLFPLKQYAREEWTWHFQSANLGPSHKTLIKKALRLCSSRREAWVKHSDEPSSQLQPSTTLGLAAQYGLRALVEHLLADTQEICGNHNNRTPLTIAIENGHFDVAQILLPVTPNLDQAFDGQLTALMSAAEAGSVVIVHELLERGADVNVQGSLFGNALQVASIRGHQEIVQQLLDQGADVNAQGGKYGNALVAASIKGSKEVVQQLLDQGADVNAQGGKYGNALVAASTKGSKEVVQQLLDRGADVNAPGGNYCNALQTAICFEYPEVVQQLLDRGADANAQGGEYGNALQAAACADDVDVVPQLLDRGADINAQGGYFGNALQAAVVARNQGVVQHLLDHSADVNAQGGFFSNALQAAVVAGDQDIVQQLLDWGANINTQGGGDRGALYAAAAYGNQELVQLLLDRGADVNAQGEEYGTALFIASLEGHQEIVQLLLDWGADVTADALDIASDQGYQGILQLLLDRGGSFDA